MQRMREVIRGTLARSLRILAEEDRLAAALPVVCGSAMAAHLTVLRVDDARTLHLAVDTPEWLASMWGMRDRLRHDLERVAGVLLVGVNFEEAGSAPDRPLRRPPNQRVQAEPGRQRPARRNPSAHPGRPE